MNPLVWCCGWPFKRASMRLALLSALAGFAGCGPTGGGTGTGDAAATLASFGATAASACSAPFAANLACSGTSDATTTATPLPGTAAVVFAGSAAGRPFTLTLAGNQAELQSPCEATFFGGDWGLQAGGEGRYFGHFVGRERGLAQPALLWVQAVAGRSDSLQVQVLDADGRPLFGPLQLERVESAPTPPAACP